MSQGQWGTPPGSQPSAGPFSNQTMGGQPPYGSVPPAPQLGGVPVGGSLPPGGSQIGGMPMGYGATPPPPPKKGVNLGVLLPILVGSIILLLGITLVVLKLQGQPRPTATTDSTTTQPVTTPTATPTPTPSATVDCTTPYNQPTEASPRGKTYKVRIVLTSDAPAEVRYTFGAKDRVVEAWNGQGTWCHEVTVGSFVYVAVSMHTNNGRDANMACTIEVKDGETNSSSGKAGWRDCTLFTPR